MFNAVELKKIAAKSGGIFRSADLNIHGVSAYRIRKLIETGQIERIKPSYYRLHSETEDFSEASLIAKLFPDGVICMYTALFYYGYTDRIPLAWDIAVDKDTSKSRFKMDYPFVQPYYLETRLLNFGTSTADYDGNSMRIFDRDRLICECVFFEKNMDRETYNKAIQSYVNDAGKNVPGLLEYAIKRNILRKVKDRIGVWL